MIPEIPTFFETIFNQTPLPFAVLKADDPAFTFQAVNDLYRQTTSIGNKDVIGKSAFEIFKPKTHEDKRQFELLFNGIRTVIREKKAALLPVLLFERTNELDGAKEQSWWQIEIHPLLNPEQEVNSLLCITRDVTEQELAKLEIDTARKREQSLYEEIAALNEELNATNEELSASYDELQEINDTLKQSQYELQMLNTQLESRIDARTAELAEAEALNEKQKERLNEVITHLPAGIAILNGQNFELEVVNKGMLSLWKRDESILGMPLLQFMPEMKEQVFPKLLKQVLDTGIEYRSQDAAVELVLDGRLQTVYMDYSYTALKNKEGVAESILVLAQDVTERTLTRKREQELIEELAASNEELASVNEELQTTNEELIDAERNLKQTLNNLAASESRFREMVKQAPVAIGVLSGRELYIETANNMILHLWGKTADIIGLPLATALPELQGQVFLQLLDNVFTSGKTEYGYGVKAKLEHEGKLNDAYFNFIYDPVKDDTGRTHSIIVVAVEVTEQVMAKMQLAEAEERARLAADAVGLGTFDLNLQTSTLVTSGRFAQILNVKKLSTLDEYLSYIHPDDVLRQQQAQQLAMETGKLFYEVRAVRKDGEIIWIKVEGKVVNDQNSNPLRILGTLLDITEQRKARDEQQKLRTLVDNSVDLMALLDMNGYNSYLNESGRQMLGFDTEEAVYTTPIKDLHLPEHFAMVENEVLPSVMTKGVWSGTMLVRNLKTHEVFPVQNNCMRIDDPITGQPIAVGAVMRDLRPELAAKQALADSERRLKNITTVAPAALWMTDEAGQITYVNQTWLNWTGTVLEDNLGTGWTNAIMNEDRSNAIRLWNEALANKSMYEAEFRIVGITGAIRWCGATGSAHFTEEGIFTGYIGACADITEQKQLQQKKDEFLSIASHELKTPLTSIKAFNQLMQRVDNPEKLKGFVGKSAELIYRLEKLISDLLDVTKINAGKLVYTMQQINFKELLLGSIEHVQHISPTHCINLQNAADVEICGDPYRLEQVLHNFISNAVKYSPGGNQVIVNSKAEAGMLTVSIQDFGIGISKEHIDKIFDRYYRVDNTSVRFDGLGLGLFISSEIIKRHNGSFHIESEKGKGSTFYFSLPLA